MKKYILYIVVLIFTACLVGGAQAKTIFEKSNYNDPLVGNTIANNLSNNSHVNSAAVPEPATLLLLGTGLIGLAGLTRRKLKK